MYFRALRRNSPISTLQSPCTYPYVTLKPPTEPEGRSNNQWDVVSTSASRAYTDVLLTQRPLLYICVLYPRKRDSVRVPHGSGLLLFFSESRPTVQPSKFHPMTRISNRGSRSEIGLVSSGFCARDEGESERRESRFGGYSNSVVFRMSCVFSIIYVGTGCFGRVRVG